MHNRSARDLIRGCLLKRKLKIARLNSYLGITASDYFYRKHIALKPDFIEGCIAFLDLDQAEANTLRLQGAIDAGWQLQHLQTKD